MFTKRFLLPTLLAVLCFLTAASQSNKQNLDVRVMSYNIRYGTAQDGENHWDKRKEFLVETIKAFDPDLLGTQETLGFQRDYLAAKLAGYEVMGVGRDDGGEKGEMTALYFKRDRFEKLDGGHFWLSETPDKPGSKSWDTALTRMATWVKLRDRRQPKAKPLVFFNTHFDHRGEQARLESARLLRRRTTEFAAQCRIIVTGDFNGGEDSPPYGAFFGVDGNQASPLRDTYRVIHPVRKEDEGSFSSFKAGEVKGPRIDWIGVSAEWNVMTATIDRTQREGRTPSDHFAVTAVVRPVSVPDARKTAGVPGVIIDYSPASSRQYIGSPSIAVLPNGEYVASHDFFGPGSTYSKMSVFGSRDKGRTWTKRADLEGQWWSTLFVHKGALYLMGTTKEYGFTVIRRSTDGGKTWTEPKDESSGLLFGSGEYHCSPQPVVIHKGRIWRAMEDAMSGTKWGERFNAFMMSAPVDADLLKASSWTASNRLARNPAWLDGKFNAWLEGNAVVTPEGKIVNILRVDIKQDDNEKAAIVRISDDGKQASFDPQKDFVDFPGGSKKFTIRWDAKSKAYWALANFVPEQHRRKEPARTRNTLALIRSTDLRNWEVRTIVLYHPDTAKHGFQYVDWLFEGNDLIAAVRTAFDDSADGAHNQHDANYLTFQRIRNFRNLTMKDSVAEFKATNAVSKSENARGDSRQAFRKLLERPRVPLAAQTAPQVITNGLIREGFSFAAEANERVPGLLVKAATQQEGRRPVVIALHGTGGTKEGQLPLLNELAEKGFVAVAIDGRYHGARTLTGKGSKEYVDAMLQTWHTGQGKPFLYDTVWDVMRLLDYLATRTDVDAARIGVIGFSKGGMEAYLAAAIDERIAVVVPCIGVQSFRYALDHDSWQSRAGTFQATLDAAAKESGEPVNAAFLRKFYDRVVPGIYGEFDGPQMVPLIAPRPLLAINGDSDARTPLAGVEECADGARAAYGKAKASEKFVLHLQPKTGHAITPEAKQLAMEWFVRWLRP
jgi:endonuclease/exonuclease/phosphatase family metal-dependent hydrolase/dienelactone hydrolase